MNANVTPITVGDVRLDPVRFMVTRNGRFLELGTREFAILEFLMRRAGQVATRAEIVAQVWGAERSGPATIVDVHIRRLRAKLDDHFPRKMIQTVRKVGYKLVD